MQRLNVMIVDDSSVAGHILKSALEDLGHRVVSVARSGAEALTAYRACNPDVVTMDITLPDMNGLDVSKKIIESFPDARIIIVSSHTEKGLVMSALNAGAKGYILKPIKADKLRETLEYVVSESIEQ